MESIAVLRIIMLKVVPSFVQSLGKYTLMLKEAFKELFTEGIDTREISKQIVSIGINSLPLVILTTLFTGMVLALQTAYGLERFGAKNYVGNIAGLGFVRELGPVLTAIVLCGRVGSGIAAEISSMVVTEQVDAIKALGASPIHKLVAPKIIAAIISTPLLTIIGNIVGVYGGLLIAVYELDIGSHLYFRSLLYTILIRDIIDGLIKSLFFGFLVVSIACYKGLQGSGGTAGVGQTTTSAVVTGCMVIFIADFVITKFLLLIQ
jgi:phospholipid/cholesterol/gamma-HCH transport system permease protein